MRSSPGADRDASLKLKRVNAGKRASKEDALRNELEKLMLQEQRVHVLHIGWARLLFVNVTTVWVFVFFSGERLLSFIILYYIICTVALRYNSCQRTNHFIEV